MKTGSGPWPLAPTAKPLLPLSDDRTVRLWRGGTWRGWLVVCCNRFRHHPLFKNPTHEPFISVCKVCEEYVWSREEMGG
jgi:hypothetical protein